MYETDRTRHSPNDTLDRRLSEAGLSRAAEGFTRRLVEGVFENRGRSDKIISELAPTWPIGQISDVDRNILRLAVFEMTMGRETPPKVAINEAVELGKIFGSDSSPRFVNGVLGSLMERMKGESDT